MPLPMALSLAQNYPNPFNPTTTISFSIPAKSHVDLSVYDITGAKIAALMNSELQAGTYRFSFSGKDERGEAISSGVYFYRLKTADKTLTRKMVFMK
jgi:flagellar hook assembly protein FlgD